MSLSDECFYMPLNSDTNEEEINSNYLKTMTDFDPYNDNIDKFLIEYGKNTYAKIIFSLLLLNPLVKLLCSGIYLFLIFS